MGPDGRLKMALRTLKIKLIRNYWDGQQYSKDVYYICEQTKKIRASKKRTRKICVTPKLHLPQRPCLRVLRDRLS